MHMGMDNGMGDPMDPQLDRFRPDPEVVGRYISRTLPGGITDIDLLLGLRDLRDSNGAPPNIGLVGATQSGKTMLVSVLACLAAARDGLAKPYPVFTLNGSTGISSYDLFGQTTATMTEGRETLVWMDGLVSLAMRCGGLLYLDEWNAVPPAQATALHPVLDERRTFTNYHHAVPDGHGGYMPEVVTAHCEMWVIATVNPGYRGTHVMAEASTNRFRWLSWEYDEATEERLVPSSVVRSLGFALREAYEQRVVTVPTGVTALRRLNEDSATMGALPALFIFTSMFPPNERDRVHAIIEDRGFYELLDAEYPRAETRAVDAFADRIGVTGG